MTSFRPNHTLPKPDAPGGGAVPSSDIFDTLGLQNIPLPEFKEMAAIIAGQFGITVNENKRTLVTGRVHSMLEKHGFANHRECLDAIRRDSSGRLLSELANRISTNHTAFYREEPHFAMLRDTVLPELTGREQRRRDLDFRVWCAACATGEEAYTLLFTLMRYFGADYPRWRAGVLATDISAAALETARRGVYTGSRLEPVPRDVINQRFNRIDDETFEVKPEVRKEVTFRRLNLINAAYPFRKRFDIIFCRNVMIYFSNEIRAQLLTKMHDWLEEGGYLFIGHSESLVGSHEGFTYVAPAVYRRNG
jgi:chemotaxis protein methyltransferase CheR